MAIDEQMEVSEQADETAAEEAEVVQPDAE